MNYIDLFNGIGGFRIALDRQGIEIENEYHSDIEKYVLDVYKKRFPDSIPLGDITKVDETKFENIDIITGGFPCQDISVAGNQKGLGENGEKTRSGLFFEITRLAEATQPKLMILENVRNLLSGGDTKGQWMRIILKELNRIGYDCEWEIISAADIGALHKRERIWFVCFKSGTTESKRGVVFNTKLDHNIGQYDGDWYVGGNDLDDFMTFDDNDDDDKILVSDFPKAGSMCGGQLYSRLPMIEPKVKTETKDDYWLSPTVVQIEPTDDRREKRTKYRKSIGRKDSPGCLAEQVAVPTMCPTPTTAVQMDPGEFDIDNVGDPKKDKDKVVDDGRFPTPRANDAQHSKFGQPSFDYRKDKRYMAEVVMDGVPVERQKGSLNPDWVEFLMGYDLDWTNVNKDESNVKSDLMNEWSGVPRLTTVMENRRHRLKGLGNAIVPQCAEFVISKIKDSGILDENS